MKMCLAQYSILAAYLIAAFCNAGATQAQTAPITAPGETLTSEFLENVLIVKTKEGPGTGFLCTYREKLYVATNQHVIFGSELPEIVSTNGEKLKPLNFIAAKNADLVLIGIHPGPNPRHPLTFAENVERVAAKGDAILVPGNSQGKGVITITPGTVIGIGPNEIEVDAPVYPGNSGSPIVHVRTKQVLGVLTKAVNVSFATPVDQASFRNKNSQIKREVRYFGHRVDTAVGWHLINREIFKQNCSLLSQADEELNSIDAFFFSINNNDWKNFRALHDAVNTADQTLKATKQSEADKVKALLSLNAEIKHLSTRRIKELSAKRKDLLFAQITALEALEARHKRIMQGSAILDRDINTMRILLQKDGE
jgi:hypothetical protein